MIYCTECGLPLTGWQTQANQYRVRCSGCHSVLSVEVKLLQGSDLTAEELAGRMNRNR
jgi:Zn finger protein HypA/HybF involved in hydrogenase expression